MTIRGRAAERFARVAWRWVRLVAALALAAAALRGTRADVSLALRNGAVAIAVLLAAASTGGVVVRALAIPRLRAMERAPLAAAAGALVLGLVTLALGGAGMLRPPIVLGAAGALAVSGAVLAPPWRAARGLARELEIASRGADGLALLAAAALGAGVLLGASAVPTGDWDTLMYHLRIPEQFLARGRIFLPPDNEHVGLVGLAHMTYVVAAAAGTPDAATVLSGLFATLLGFAVFAAAARAGGPRVGRLAVAGVAGTTVLVYVAFTPRTDATVALFLFLAHAALWGAARGRSSRLVLAAGLMAACAVGTKVHALPYLAPLAAWAAWLGATRRVPLRLLAGGAALAAGFSTPWLLKNALLLGDPFFPLLAGERVPPWLASDPRVRAVASAIGPSIVGLARAPITLAALLRNPAALSPEPEAALYVWSPLLLAGTWLALAHRRAWGWVVPPAAYVALLVVRTRYTNLRYLVAAVPALSVAAALATARLVARPWLPRWLVPVLAIAALWPAWRALDVLESGVRGARDGGDLYQIAADATRLVPPDGRVLMLYDARGRPFQREVLQDNIATTWPLLARSGHADACLAGLRVTHVLVDAGALAFYSARARPPPEVADGSLRRFIQRCLVLEATRGSIGLFRLRGGESASKALARPDVPGGER